jgi:GNAT superfamily N-acetyltransferase
MMKIRPISLPVAGMDELQLEARNEGYDFLDRLVEDWLSGENRFDGPGELFCGCFEEDALVGVGGLNCDPFLDDPGVGRLRRVYVRQAWRNRGIGEALVRSLLTSARASFRSVRLRAENANAARLYERIGFTSIDDPHATHILVFERATT